MANALFGGWTMSGIFEFVKRHRLFGAQQRRKVPNRTSGYSAGRQRGDGPTKNPATTGGTLDRIASAGQSGVRYFDRTAFDDPGPGRYGNSARIIDDARYQFRKNIDFVVAKNTEIGGGTIAQVRFEILNLTNTPKFGRVDSGLHQQLGLRPCRWPAGLHAHLADQLPPDLLRRQPTVRNTPRGWPHGPPPFHVRQPRCAGAQSTVAVHA